MLEERGQIAEAAAAYHRADERGVADAPFRARDAARRRGQTRRSRAVASARGPARPCAAAHNLGLLLEERGDIAGAAAAYRRADDRGVADSAFQLAMLLAAHDRVAEAEEALARAEQRGHPEAARASPSCVDPTRDRRSPVDTEARLRQRAAQACRGSPLRRSTITIGATRTRRTIATSVLGSASSLPCFAPDGFAADGFAPAWPLGYAASFSRSRLPSTPARPASRRPTTAAAADTKPAAAAGSRPDSQNCDGPVERRCRAQSDSGQSIDANRDNGSRSEEGHGLERT